MSVVSGRFVDTIALARERLRPFSDTISTAALWSLIGALFLWAAFAQTQLFVVGIIVGSVLALGAIGLTLLYGILRFANFAHGDTMMLGAYLAFLFLSGTVVGERATADTAIAWGPR